MYGLTRGTMTLIGVAVAGFLIWLGTQFETDSGGEYWTRVGLFAAAGLTMALSQLLGGWTKWGWPRVSGSVFLIGFLPALLVGGWVILAAQPGDWLNTSNWSSDLGIRGLVRDLEDVAGLLAFGLGLTFGLTFDTTGRPAPVEQRQRIAARPTRPARETAVADEPLAAERAAVAEESFSDGAAVSEPSEREPVATQPGAPVDHTRRTS